MAAGLTFTQVVNRVLERLREDSVASFDTTTYSTFIAGIVNQVKSEIEDAWNWHALRDSYTVDATNPNASYALTDAGQNVHILDGWNRTHGFELKKSTNKDFNRKFFGTPEGTSVSTGPVCEYLQTGLDDDLDIKIDVYPVPNGDQTLVFNVYKPQDYLDASATVPLVPQNVLIEETIARALLERGEEGAQPPQPGAGAFIRVDLLAAAITRDQGADPTETDWDWE
jgi:hypothetical protein